MMIVKSLVPSSDPSSMYREFHQGCVRHAYREVDPHPGDIQHHAEADHADEDPADQLGHFRRPREHRVDDAEADAHLPDRSVRRGTAP